MITAAVARANVDDITLEGPDFVDKSALRSVFGYSVAIAVFILIIFVVIVAIRVLGIGVINEFWVIFGIMVCQKYLSSSCTVTMVYVIIIRI